MCARDLRDDVPSLGMEAASALLSVVGEVLATGSLPQAGAGLSEEFLNSAHPSCMEHKESLTGQWPPYAFSCAHISGAGYTTEASLVGVSLETFMAAEVVTEVAGEDPPCATLPAPKYRRICRPWPRFKDGTSCIRHSMLMPRKHALSM